MKISVPVHGGWENFSRNGIAIPTDLFLKPTSHSGNNRPHTKAADEWVFVGKDVMGDGNCLSQLDSFCDSRLCSEEHPHL